MTETKRFDIIIAGVGGQGIVLCSDILGEACILEDIPVKGSEVHGMAQRGGSVEAHIRIGCIYGPRIPEGSADLLIAMEPLEGARFSHYLKESGTALVNTSKIPLLGQDYEVNDILKIVREKTPKVIAWDFTSEAIKAGSIRTLNVLMLGTALKSLPLKEESLTSAIRQKIKKRYIEMNLGAFNLGISTAD
jgi:indolepyruvate ferredoxin oxidoreductase, beta subunit